MSIELEEGMNYTADAGVLFVRATREIKGITPRASFAKFDNEDGKCVAIITFPQAIDRLAIMANIIDSPAAQLMTAKETLEAVTKLDLFADLVTTMESQISGALTDEQKLVNNVMLEGITPNDIKTTFILDKTYQLQLKHPSLDEDKISRMVEDQFQQFRDTLTDEEWLDMEEELAKAEMGELHNAAIEDLHKNVDYQASKMSQA